MTVGELLERIEARELTEWMAFYQLEPFGEQRADLRAGIVTAMIANVNRDKKKRRKPHKPQDFMPQFDRPQRAASWDEIKRGLMDWWKG